MKPSLPMSLLAAAILTAACGPGPRTVVRVIEGKPQSSRFVSPSAYLHYMRSRIALDRGQVAEARHQLEQALLFDPGSPHLLTRLAELKARTGELDQALAHLDQALAARPGFPGALRVKAQVLWRLKRPDEAEQTLERCVTLNPGYAPCLEATK